MDFLPCLIDSLSSFHNLYKAVLRCIERDPKSATSLSPVLGLTVNSMRHRLRNPRLWQLDEIEQVALYYKLPVRACSHLREAIRSLGPYLDQLTDGQRKQLEQVCQMKMPQIVKRLESAGLVHDVEKLYAGLTSLGLHL